MTDSKTVHLETYGNSAEILVAIGAMPPIAPPAAGSPSAAPAPSAKPK
jgi:hypothetical protein